MDISRGESFRLGVFLTLATAILVGLLLFLVGKQLWEKQDRYYTVFEESVDGLAPGVAVKLNGVSVGQVTDILVDSENISKIIVWFEVKRKTPIRDGMQANLVGGISITGLKRIELTGGDNEGKRLKPGNEIPSGISQMKQLTGQAEAIALKFETVLNNLNDMTNDRNQLALSNILQNVDKFLVNSDSLVVEMKALPKEIKATLNSIERTSEDVRKADIGKQIDETLAIADKALKDMQAAINQINNKVASTPIRQTTESFMSAAKSIESTSKRADIAIYKVQDNLTASMKSLRMTMENLNDFSSQIKDNPSLLLRGENKKGRER